MNATTDTSTRRAAQGAGYSPERRTALVFSGTGTAGAYHAGVLRALQEAGVRIDLVAGHGIGAAAAALGAIDGGARLWDTPGIWSAPATRRLYGWKGPLRLMGWQATALAVLLAVPLLVLVAALVVFVLGFLLTLVGLDAGLAVTGAASGWLQSVFTPEQLPTILPRFVMLVFVMIAVTAGAALAMMRLRAPARRRSAGGSWWGLFGAPLDAEPARRTFVAAIWQLIRGAAAEAPDRRAIGRRYAEVLADSLGQPGFRELIAVAADLDARRDLTAALLREPFRSEFMSSRPGRDRRADVCDLAGSGRDHAIDILCAALTPAMICDPALVTFGPESYWRGETHRLCDRPAALVRVLQEVDAAGARQVVIVSAVGQTEGPHRLSAPRLDPRHRAGEYLLMEEAQTMADAIARSRATFETVYVISPAHNPLGPFDFSGRYDEASDRRYELAELLDRGYDDAHRQFIEPVVGASGEHLAQARG